MKHLRVAERLFNRPLMISEPKLNTILHIFGQKSGLDLVGLPSSIAGDVTVSKESNAGYVVKNGVGIIGIFGPLMHRVLAMEFPSGGPMTYAAIQTAFDRAQEDNDVHTIVGLFGTPGGEVSGAFDLADHIYHSRGKKPLLAIVDEEALSAGYLIASSFDRIVMPRTGVAGSIGVIATHADFSRMEEAAGVKVTHVYSGARKADFSSHQPLSVEALNILQRSVDESCELFIDTVARNRGLTTQSIRAMEAGFFEGKHAVNAKIVDEIISARKALASVGNGSTYKKISASTQTGPRKMETKTMNIQEIQENHPEIVDAIRTEARAGMIDKAEAEAEADAVAATAAAAESGRILALAAATLGEDLGKKLETIVGAGLTAEQVQALGVTFAAETSAVEQQMLAAITAAAAAGVRPAQGASNPEKTGIDTAAIYARRRQAVAG